MASIWDDARREFPAAERYVYLNAAAASPTPRAVRAAVEQYLEELERDGDRHWDAWNARRESVRAAVAAFVGADADEITFTPNTSTGINIAVDLVGDLGAVITDTLEFPAVTLPWIHRGVEVRFVEPSNGIVAAGDFHPERTAGSAVIAVSHVQFSNGCRLDLEALGRVKAGRHLVVSGSQSVGALPIDVRRAAVDVLAVAGHKWLCAGYGAGFTYVARHLLERIPPRSIGWLSTREPFRFDNRRYELITGAARYELGCPPFAPIFALGAAVDFLSWLGIDRISERVLALNTYLTDQLGVAGIPVRSPGGRYRSGESLVDVPAPAAATRFLADRGVLVTEKPEGIRVATHFYNTERDIDRAVDALREFMALRSAAGDDTGPIDDRTSPNETPV